MKPQRVARTAAIAWTLASVFYLLAETLAAAAFSPGYDYGYNYISDLGVVTCGVAFEGRSICSPLHNLMNTAFITEGLLFFLAGWCTTKLLVGTRKAVFLALVVVHSIGIILVGTFHGSTAAIADGTARYHMFGAVLAIVGGNVVIWVSAPLWKQLGPASRQRLLSIVLPILGLLSTGMLVLNMARPDLKFVPDGVWERGGVYSIILWNITTGLWLFGYREPQAGPGSEFSLIA